MKPFKPMSNAATAVMRERSLSFYHEAFHEAGAIADAALEAVADFASQARFSCKADVEAFAALNLKAYEAERTYRHARHRLLLEFAAAVNTANETEDSPPW